MKTLIFNGSPKKNGDTEVLVNELAKKLIGEVKIISCFNNISPCVDCRFCWSNTGCSINDEMQEVYSYLDDCDNVVLASPIWFSSLSGPLLNLTSRMQTKFANVHRPTVQNIYSLDTNNISAKEDVIALEKCHQVAGVLNIRFNEINQK